MFRSLEALGGPAEVRQAGFCPDRLARADALIQRHIAEGKLPGAITLVARGGSIVHANIQGWSDMEAQVPLAADHIFRMYSLTKIVTTVALLSVYEEGLVDLNDPVSKYIPAFADQQVQRADGSLEPAQRPTTVYDLLRFCAGVTTTEPLDGLFKSSHTLETLCDDLGRAPLQAQPGTQWLYGYATDVTARITEIVTGQSFDEVLRERIFAPLEMHDTGFQVPDSAADRLTACYTFGEDRRLHLYDERGPGSRFRGERSFLSASGGLVSTTRDYLNFAGMLLNRGTWNGHHILGRKTVDLMTMDHLPAGHPDLEIGTQCFRYGLGVSVVTDVARSRCLSSLGDFGWGGAAGTQAWMNPEEDLVVMIMIQVRAASTYTGIMDIYKRLVYQALV